MSARRLPTSVAAATGYHVLSWWDNGIRHISNAERPIRTPADCIGFEFSANEGSTLPMIENGSIDFAFLIFIRWSTLRPM